ncbi:MAG: family 10 glycosylhydrolase [Bacteroidota bacterium]
MLHRPARTLPIVLALLLLATACRAQEAPPREEFRGAWIATVINLDWPKTSAGPSQRQRLRNMLDSLQTVGINAVFFQVRSEGDAMYASDLEPWSYWLNGEQGKAPEPFYDPLAFVIEEAHARGMELHAWFNPFRASRNAGGYPLDPSHALVENPEWMLTFGNLRLFDPGLPAVRDYITTVIMDVVRRYDIDGVHFDDYFYPYPPNQVTNQDAASFAAHSRGVTNRGDWRRENINLFVQQVGDSIRAVKPHVKYGISPFGIWKSGVPAGIVGLDAYETLYADATAWLDNQSIDYVIPQLYWAFGGGQDYASLATWWSATSLGRHLYTGHGLYRADRATFSGTLYNANEVPRQVRYNRGDPGIQGSVFFRAENLYTLSTKGIRDSLRTTLYRHPAFTPTMSWKDQTPPGTPVALAATRSGGQTVALSWQPPAVTGAEAPPRFYAVYRVQAAVPPSASEIVADVRNVVAITGQTIVEDTPSPADEPYHYVVTALSPNSIESTPTAVVSIDGQAVSVERPFTPTAFTLDQNYPNPFNPETIIRFTLQTSAPVTLTVYNVQGQEMTRLVDNHTLRPGPHTYTVDASTWPSGTYFYTLSDGAERQTRPMLLLR